jgi:hypothetical protein
LQRPNELVALLLIFGLMSIFYPELLEVVVSLGVLLIWSILYVKADNIYLFDLIIIIDQKPFKKIIKLWYFELKFSFLLKLTK